MVSVKNWLRNRRYSSRMVFFIVLAMISMLIIQDRFGLNVSATEQILTPPEYEEYSRVMLVPIILMTLIPVTWGMWLKEKQLQRSGRLVELSKDYELPNNPLLSEAEKLMKGETINERDEEEETDDEYIFE